MYSKPSVKLERESTFPSAEEDSMEPEDPLANERGRLEISSNTQNQDDASEDDPGCLKASKLTNNLNHIVLRCIILISFIRHFLDILDMLGEDSLSEHTDSTLGGAAAIYSSALDMTLKVKQLPIKTRFSTKTLIF